MTRPYAEVIGDPIAQSKSPLIHNFWLAKLGIDAEYRACHVRAEQLEDYFTRRREDAEWRGCNVTIPHKVEVFNFVDRADTDLLAAANTVAPRDGGLVAWNTDVFGLLEPLAEFPFLPALHVDEAGSEHISVVQVIGAGGAAEAALAAASRAEYLHQEIFNRSVERAREVAARHSISRTQALSLESFGPLRCRPEHALAGCDAHYLVINASPLGMTGYPPLPINLSNYPNDTIVFDMVYSPLRTPLLQQAMDLGMRPIDGLQMLVAQASLAFEKFFGQPAPREHDAELRALLTAQ